MTSCRTIAHPFDLSAPGGVDALLAFHRGHFGDARMEVEDKAGDGGKGGESGGDAGDAGEEDQARGPGTDGHKPVAEMTDAERADYFSTKSDRLRDALRKRGDYDDLKAKAGKFDKAQQDAETAHEKALREAVDAARNEGKAEAKKAIAHARVESLFDATLTARGKTSDEVKAALKHINLESFVTDDAADTDAVRDYCAALSSPGTGKTPDFGNGRRGNPSGNTGVDAGREMFEATHKK